METTNFEIKRPGISNAFGMGWDTMMNDFLRLFLVILILAIVATPFKVFNFKFDPSDMNNFPWGSFRHGMNNDLGSLFAVGSLGLMAAFFGMLAVLYAFLVAPIFDFGGNMIFVQAVRRQKVDFEYLIKGFTQNYLHIILANLLVFALVILGIFALIIPGIIIGCRLAFVSYIIMDKKLDPIEAVEMSWRLTRGHGWKIFFMGFASIFIFLFGLILLIVGVFPAMIWISSSFAALYESVLKEKEKPAEVLAA